MSRPVSTRTSSPRRGRRSTTPAPRATSHRRPSGAAARRTPQRPGKPGARKLLRWVAGCLVLGLLGVSGLLAWSILSRGPAEAEGPVFVHLDSGDKGALARELEAQGLVQSGWLMHVYLRWLLPTVDIEPGEHLLRGGLSPRDLSARLARLPRRSSARVVVPEGWHRKRIAQRLEKAEICSAAEFLRATERPELLQQLNIFGLSAEGYLFPATYDLAHNTPAADIVTRMVKETRKRLQALAAKHPGALERLEAEYGLDELRLLTLASVVEKETAQATERPLIASVFLNRLAHPEGETRGRLQSDPTAAYGCEFEPERAASCAGFRGQVSPAMLRDPDNRYNTYRHGGLPPGPIASPGVLAVEAVLAPTPSDYLFFVADGAGNHAFSRTFEEHQLAVARLRSIRGPSVEAE